MNDKGLLPWLTVVKDGSILSAHCTCMADFGESCSHVAAVAFMVSFQSPDNNSCTDKLCHWNVPKTVQKVVPKRLKDIEACCFCGEAVTDKNMVSCSNEDCVIKLFHIECVQLDGFIEEGVWLCDACSELFDADAS